MRLDGKRGNGDVYCIVGAGMGKANSLFLKVIFDIPVNMNKDHRKKIAGMIKDVRSANR